MPIRIRTLLGLAIAMLTCIVLYWPTLQAPFLFDDFPNLSALASVEHVRTWRELGIYLSQPRDFPGRPLAMLSFLLQKSAWPDYPLQFRLVNIGIHLFNGALVFWLVLHIARVWFAGGVRDDEGEWRPYLAASLAAAAWLLNPIQLSGVALIVQRMTLLMAAFVLLGLLAYLHGLLSTDSSTGKRGIWMGLGLGGCTALAFLSKENGILLPLYALVLDSTVLREAVDRLPRTLRWWRRLLIWPAVLFVTTYLLWQGWVHWGDIGIRHFTVGERLLTEPRALASYLDKIVLPRFGLYGLYHDGFEISRGLLNPWSTALHVAALVVAVAFGCAARRRWPLLSLAILWYLGGHLLESSTIMLELYFEHRNYVPLVGMAAAAAIAIAGIRTDRTRHLALLAGALWLLACCITTGLSAGAYISEDRLATVWAKSQPDSIRAQSYLADRLLRHGHPDRSLQVIDAVARNHPDNSGLAENRLYLLCSQGAVTNADVERMDAVLRVAPFDRSGFENMSTLRELARAKRCAGFDDTVWLRSLDILLGNPAYGNGLPAGFLHYQKHLWAVENGHLDTAIAELDAANDNDPDAEIPRLQAKYLISAGLYDEAIGTLKRADYARLPLLRRLLVDDRAINAAAILEIERMSKSPAAKNEAIGEK